MARGGSSSSSTVGGVGRKDAERNRRIRMKNLCLILQSLVVPPNGAMKRVPVRELLKHAAEYIKQQEERVEGMKKTREKVQQLCSGGMSSETTTTHDHDSIIEVRDVGSTLEVTFSNSVLINGSSLLSDIMRIMKEEGAEVISASFHNIGGVTHHTIHSQAYCSRVGVETNRIFERLKDLDRAARRFLHSCDH